MLAANPFSHRYIYYFMLVQLLDDLYQQLFVCSERAQGSAQQGISIKHQQGIKYIMFIAKTF